MVDFDMILTSMGHEWPHGNYSLFLFACFYDTKEVSICLTKDLISSFLSKDHSFSSSDTQSQQYELFLILALSVH